MVLSDKNVKSKAQDILEKTWRYMVIDVEDLEEDREKLKQVVELTQLINTIMRANSLYAKVTPERIIDDSIIYEVIKAIYSQSPFTKDQLRRYYKLMQELDIFSELLIPFAYPVVSGPSPVEYMLLGLTFEDHRSLSEKDQFKIEDEYNTFLYSDRNLHGDIDKVIKKEKEIVSKFKKTSIEVEI